MTSEEYYVLQSVKGAIRKAVADILKNPSVHISDTDLEDHEVSFIQERLAVNLTVRGRYKSEENKTVDEVVHCKW